jgi:hypothetical protein
MTRTRWSAKEPRKKRDTALAFLKNARESLVVAKSVWAILIG